MNRVKSNLHLLKALSGPNPKLRRAILQNCDSDLIKCLAEISLNVLEGRIILSKKQAAKLRPFKQTLRLLAGKKAKLGTKRTVLVKQSGGALPAALLGPLLGIAISIVTEKLIK